MDRESQVASVFTIFFTLTADKCGQPKAATRRPSRRSASYDQRPYAVLRAKATMIFAVWSHDGN
ncbi:MAG TPA: hypothetical protein VFE16_10325 [Candidatus Cybelea sp.]|jgi:hypothetical protein|nr:hypothetical protein [Candidatus Cybelea sp.]